MSSLYARLAPWLLDIIELLLLLAACALAFWNSRKTHAKNPPKFRSLQTKFASLARHKRLAVIAPGLLVLLLRTALIPILGVPAPRYHDEFSYLLAADTFAHGRVTNPTHPMWIHFESIHIIQQPTYMSMYPPGQGLVLAAGQLLGNPWIGQLLITAILCSAICWTLQAWMPPGWALFGGWMAALRIGLLSYWMNGFWSAALPALGGALLFGALPRIVKHARACDGLLMGLGLVILANTRPYEGLVFSLPFAVSMLIWIFARSTKSSARFSVLVPLLLVIFLGAAATGYYYWRVTGSPFVLTYQVNRASYATAPLFLWQTPRSEPVYRHPSLRDNYRHELAGFQESRTFPGALRKTWEKLKGAWQFYLGPLFTFPLLLFPWIFRDRRIRLALIAGFAVMLAVSVETWGLPHYFAPATVALYIVLIQCVRHVRVWRRRQGLGLALVRVLPLIACAMIALRLTAIVMQIQLEPKWPRGNLDRADIVRDLQDFPGDHLVFVRYSEPRNSDYEWVYNRADIDHSRIVWARDMGTEKNQELLRYFPNRRAWLVQPDYDPPKIGHY